MAGQGAQSMSANTQQYDVVVIGAGHNGLTCAAYLGMAGLKVKVVERRPIVGGAAVTEEFHPGFRNSIASYTVSLLNPKVIRDLRLHQHGLRIVERRAQNFLPSPDGQFILSAEGRTEAEVAKLSRGDAERYAAFNRDLDVAVDVLRELVLQAPPNLATGVGGLVELIKAGALGRKLRRLTDADLRTIYGLFTRSAGEHLDNWFEHDLVKALFGFDAVVGFYGSPYTPGTGYVLLHHAFGEVNGKRRVWQGPPQSTASRSRPMRRCASCSSRAAAPPASCCRMDAPSGPIQWR
jgi:phytoene dehydrogenase-like protein